MAKIQSVYILLFGNMDGIMIPLWLMLYLELQKLLQRGKDMMIADVGSDISLGTVKPFSKFCETSVIYIYRN